MYQVVYEINGEKKFVNYDCIKDMGNIVTIYKNFGYNPVVYHKTAPTKPSKVPLPVNSGFHKNIWTGDREIQSSRIVCDRFTVTFTRTASADIDMFCDSLNGWFTSWSENVTIRLYMDGNVWTKIEPLDKADTTFERLLKASKEPAVNEK